MKKSLFKLILGMFATVMLFSSCLGDGSNETGNSGAFAYITTDQTGIKYAVVDTYRITSTAIQGLEAGSCYLIDYRFSFENQSSSGIYQNATMSSQPVLLVSTMGAVGTATTVTETFNPYDFQPYAGSFDSPYGYNLGVAYIAKLKETDSPRAYFFYDAKKQFEMTNDGVTQEDVKENQIIIDVRFAHTNGADGSQIKAGRITVGNLYQIREAYKRSDKFKEGSGEYTDVAIKFRYNQLQSDDKTVKEDVYVGSWTPAPYSYYCFRYHKAE
ncbi:MAG: hypothetical protein LBV43_07630 [Prevotella sp.]|jgi:hypothetical protein|nr:hypothetical protein [Prevotella sp.]